MKSNKMLLTLFSITAILLLASLGLNLHQYLQIKKMSGAVVSKDNIQVNSSTESSSANSQNREEKIAVANTENKTGTDKINELEYHLGAAEEEASIAYGQLSDELTKKEEFKKAREKLNKSMLSESSLKKSRDIFARERAEDYGPLLNKLDLSEEEAKKLKDLLFEQNRESFISIAGVTTEEEEKEMMKKASEHFMKYKDEIRALLGEEKYSIYDDYSNRIPDRTSLNEFMESLPPENRISDEQAERLIDAMYDGRVSTYSYMPTGITSTTSNQSEMRKLSMEIQKRTNEKYLEASRGILSPEQVEQYKNYLLKKSEATESMMKMSEYLNE
ncbi:MAG: hypothetical protein QUS12_05535, partial [Methanosarcina sp.]|nr:hypothetical protein [Methanosarcina sp.]